jgi:hypothetical protein
LWILAGVFGGGYEPPLLVFMLGLLATGVGVG